MKRCNQCGVEKPLDAFHKHSSTADGRQFWCKACRSAYAAAGGRAKRSPYDPKNPSRSHQGRIRDWLAPWGLKHCWECGHTLPLDAFGRKRTSKDSLQSECKRCFNMRDAQHRAEIHAGKYGACGVVDSEGNVCGRPTHNLESGLCRGHYTRVSRGSDLESPLRVLRPRGLPTPLAVVEWFLAEIRPDENGCWPWSGSLNDNGYGKVCVSGVYHKAHRLVYENLMGEDLTGLHLHHECRNPSCVNPEHLTPMTAEEHLALHNVNNIMELVEAV